MAAKYSTVAETAVYSVPQEEGLGSDTAQRLKDVLLKNQRLFSRESPYLDALLVYVSPA
jgi:hypothetical protein